MKKILIADDETTIRSLLRKLLDKRYDIIEATDGKKAVDMARTERPDLILLDIMMPKMDGCQVCQVLKAYKPTSAIPVVILTSLGDEPNRELVEGTGADGYIAKPFSSKRLLDTIEYFLGHSGKLETDPGGGVV